MLEVEIMDDLLNVWEFIKQNNAWLIPLVVPTVTIIISHREFSRKLKHELKLANDRTKSEFKRIQTDHQLQQQRQNNDFITKLTFDNLTEFLEIAPKAVRETQFYLADEVIRFMDKHKDESDESLLNTVVKSELLRKIDKEGRQFNVNIAKSKNLLIYASDENSEKFFSALNKLSTESFYITSFFWSGKFGELRERIKPYSSPEGLNCLEMEVGKCIDDVRYELNLIIKAYR